MHTPFITPQAAAHLLDAAIRTAVASEHAVIGINADPLEGVILLCVRIADGPDDQDAAVPGVFAIWSYNTTTGDYAHTPTYGALGEEHLETWLDYVQAMAELSSFSI